jgi:uncharacterized membrane protein YvbJ
MSDSQKECNLNEIEKISRKNFYSKYVSANPWYWVSIVLVIIILIIMIYFIVIYNKPDVSKLFTFERVEE